MVVYLALAGTAVHACSRSSPVGSCRCRTSNIWSASPNCRMAPVWTGADKVIDQHERHLAEDGGHRATRWNSPACRSMASPTARTPGSCSCRRRRSSSGRRRSCPAARSRASLNQQFGSHPGAPITAVFPPPPVQGLGTIGGFKLEIEDRAGLGYEALDEATKAFLAAAAKAPELGRMFTGYQVNVPQIYLPISTGSGRSSLAWPCRMCSTRCRPISARSMSTISTCSAVRIRCGCRRTRNSAPMRTISAG